MNESERLLKVRDHFNLSTRGMAIKCNLHQATLDRQIKGTRSVSIETLQGVAKTFPEISIDWIVTGRGEMLQSELRHELDENVETINALNSLVADQALENRKLRLKISELENQIK